MLEARTLVDLADHVHGLGKWHDPDDASEQEIDELAESWDRAYQQAVGIAGRELATAGIIRSDNETAAFSQHPYASCTCCLTDFECLVRTIRDQYRAGFPKGPDRSQTSSDPPLQSVSDARPDAGINQAMYDAVMSESTTAGQESLNRTVMPTNTAEHFVSTHLERDSASVRAADKAVDSAFQANRCACRECAKGKHRRCARHQMEVNAWAMARHQTSHSMRYEPLDRSSTAA